MRERLHLGLVTGGTRGLQLDAALIKSSLRPGDHCTTYTPRKRNLQLPHIRLLLRLEHLLTNRPDLLVFLENIHQSWAALPIDRVLISNQEWIREGSLPYFSGCKEIWCKTRYAYEQFLERGYQARYIGFKSRDLRQTEIAKNPDLCIHVAGRSHLKGTRTLLEIWQRHPEWPRLLVICTLTEWIQRFSAPNISLQSNDLSDEALLHVMNEASIHLCPSETEGFGHYISEAMSTESLVVTIDAPPMNEITQGSYAYRAGVYASEPMGFGERFYADPDSLEHVIESALSACSTERASRGLAARTAFLEQCSNFDTNIGAAINAVTGRHAST